MTMNEAAHSTLEKRFLGQTIPANTPGRESVSRALDIIFDHPNVAPFVSRQLIQRFVTSHPEPEYIARVSGAFDSGIYELPDGTAVGDGRRGDLKATLAAVLFDPEARGATPTTPETFGKVREPAIRVANWARAFGVTNAAAEYTGLLWEAGSPSALAQQPFSSKSVFNFYRPGYVAPGTLSGARSLTVPELQIVNAASLAGFPNFMEFFIFGESNDPEFREELRAEFLEDELDFNDTLAQTAFVPNYSELLPLADEPAALINRLDQLLTYSSMSSETKSSLTGLLSDIAEEAEAESEELVMNAIFLVMTTPDYIFQQ